MKKRFTDKHPVLGLLLFTYGAFIISEFLVGIILMFALSSVIKDSETATAIGGCIGAVLVLVLWYARYSKEYHFMPRKGELSGALRLIMPPMLVYWLFLFGAYAVLAKAFPFAAPTMKIFFLALLAGLVEEVCFREVAVSFMARTMMSEKRIPWIAAVSGLLFGLTHLTNIFSGKPLFDVAYQVLLCIFTGVFFAAIYLRKGNVWILCLFHFLHDFLAFMGVNGLAAVGVTDFPDWMAVYIAVLEGVLCLYGFYLLRKAKRKEIIRLWDYKWSRDSAD